jgi:hypothetical protein
VSAGWQSPIQSDYATDSGAESEHNYVEITSAGARRHFTPQSETCIIRNSKGSMHGCLSPTVQIDVGRIHKLPICRNDPVFRFVDQTTKTEPNTVDPIAGSFPKAQQSI